MKLEMYFRFQDKNNLVHYHTCFPEYKDAHSDFKCGSDISEGHIPFSENLIEADLPFLSVYRV